MGQAMTIQELFTGPETWTQGTYARSREGCDVAESSPTAVSFCLAGAFYFAYAMRGQAYSNEFKRVADAIGVRDTIGEITNWNDDPSRTFADIRRVIEQANV